MHLEISQRLVQKTILAPVLQQSIEVLLLPVMELHQAIEQELQSNPVLEVDETSEHHWKVNFEDAVYRRIKHANCDDHHSVNDPGFHSDDDIPDHKPITKSAPLEDYLMSQLRLELDDALDLKIGELIIGNLDEDGYFRTSCEEIAQLLGLHEIKKVKDVLNVIQNFEPLGIASRNLRECLLTQVYYKYNGKSAPIAEVINNYLEEIGRKQYAKIAALLKVPLDQVRDVAKIISGLDPRPARKYRPEDQSLYVKPDVTVKETAEGMYSVIVNAEYIPTLKVSRFYQELLKQNNRPVEEVAFVQDKIKSAFNFIKSIQQRNSTVKGIADYIVEHQKDFFMNGPSALKPMVLRDVATAIGRNESTISRAINSKYMDTPQGFYQMKYFFNQAACKSEEEKQVTGTGIKEEIKSLIEIENKVNPLSDQEIRLHFERKQIPISRRTIAKYRQALRILPSNLRRI